MCGRYALTHPETRQERFAAGTCAGWLAHPWLKAMDRAVDTAPGHTASARCAQACLCGVVVASLRERMT